MKYITFITEHGQQLPVVFPEALTHSLVSQVMCAAIEICLNAKARPLSAGFAGVGVDVSVHGNSETLGISSRPIDAIRIMAGDSIAFMPDNLAESILAKIDDRKAEGDTLG